MSAPTVTVYTAGPSCIQCRMTKRHLDGRGIAYTEVAIDSDEKILGAAVELGLSTAPIVCVTTPEGNSWWDGYRPDRIDALVRAA